MLLRIFIISCFFTFFFSPIYAQYPKQTIEKKPYFVGSTLFVLGNLSNSNKPDFAQINFGYRFGEKSVLSMELKTWKYAWPLGIPFGRSFESPSEQFPGYIREKGFAFCYQRFWWKGLYSAIHVMSAWQSFHDEGNVKIDNGFQLFNTYRIGYHFAFFKNVFFIEPSLAITHRPFHTNMPTEFAQIDQRWPKYFLGEPGFHIGFNF